MFNFRIEIVEYPVEGKSFERSFWNNIFDPDSHRGFRLNIAQTHYFSVKSKGLVTRRLKEKLFVEITGLRFPPNDKLFEIFDNKFQQLFQAGFIDKYAPYEPGAFDPKRFVLEDMDPQQLTMHTLKGGFMLCLVPLSLAIIAFFCEWLARLKDYIIIRHLLVAYFKQVQIDTAMSFKYNLKANDEHTAQILNLECVDEEEQVEETGMFLYELNSPVLKRSEGPETLGDTIETLYDDLVLCNTDL